MCSEYISSSPRVTGESSDIHSRMSVIVWDERVAILQQSIEAKQALRLARIEQECSRIRRPPRKRGSERSVLQVVNASPVDKDVAGIQSRFAWLKVDPEKLEAYCVSCTPFAPTVSRWSMLSPRGRLVVPHIETHSFSSTHKIHDNTDHTL